MSSDQSADYRLLPLIPVFALREAALAADPDGGLRSLDGAALRAKVEKSAILTAAQVRDLFEKWRYGERPAFVLALFLRELALPAGLREPLQEAIEARFEGECPILMLDEDRSFDRDIVELGLRYEHAHHFIDLAEEPQTVTELRYGFVWLDAPHRFAAIGASEEVAAAVLGGLGTLVKHHPLRVSISKDALDKHFPLSAISSIAHIDTVTGVKHRVSGPTLKDKLTVFREISRRDKDEFRVGALYGQELPGGRRINVGVNAPLGRMFLTGVVSATDVRTWALPTLKELAAALHELRKQHPDTFSQVVRVTRGLTGVSDRYATLVQPVLLALVEARQANASEFPVALHAEQLAKGLPKKFGELRCTPYCTRCDDVGPVMCANCGGTGVQVVDGRVECAVCDSSDGLECDRSHHPGQTAMRDGLHFVTGAAMLSALSEGLANLGLDAIDRTREALSVRGKILLRLDKGPISDGVYACVYVDLAGSTELLRRDEDAHLQAVNALRDVIQAAAACHGGRYAQDTGDGGFALFPEPADALEAARTMAASVVKTKAIPRENRPRIGLGTGRVIAKGGHFIGLAINIAARLQEKSKETGGILIDEATASATGLKLQRVAALSGLRGLSEEPGGYYRLPRADLASDGSSPSQ